MRNFLAAFCLFVAATAFAGPPADFQAANAAYAEGRYSDARDAYQKLVESGNYSANLFYNLGNAWYRLDQPGRAVLAFQRTLVLSPGHSDALANLQLIRQTTGARAPAEPAWTNYYPILGAGAWVWIATLAAWALVFAVTARLFGLVRPRLAWSVAAAALLLGLGAIPMLLREQANANAAVVVSAETIARYAPTSSGGTAERLPAGSVVRLLAERGDWSYAESPDAQKLWIPSADLAPVRL